MNVRSGSTPDDPSQLLLKVFALETRKGFQDTAVSGGLQAFIPNHASKLRSGNGVDARHLVTLFSDYANLGPDQRRERIAQAQQMLATTPSASPPPVQTTAAAPAPARRRSTPSPRRRTQRAVRITSLDDPVTVLPRVGDARARQLAALGVATVRDLINLLPRRHKDYGQAQSIASVLFRRECTVRGRVVSVDENRTSGGRALVTVEIADDTGRIKAIWFNPYIAKQLRAGVEVAISGPVEQQRGTVCFKNPEWELIDEEMLHTGRIVPIYPLTRNLYQKSMRQLTRMALDAGKSHLHDPLPPNMLQKHGLLPLTDALEWIHFPESEDHLRRARARLAFDEFLTLQIGLVRRKVDWQMQAGHAFAVDRGLVGRFLDVLPFQLTGAQQRALDEILSDMAHEKPMSRLLQGDVGSGKTVVAATAAMAAIADGFQVAILAPTEILAEQHYRSLTRIFEAVPDDERPVLALLTGSTGTAERDQIDEGLNTGRINILVGTHAIIEERVTFERLGLAVIDEQHRFGVAQRARLREKGYNPDILVMTATPIPRSLALVIHGDLDVSIIDELPPGRETIATHRISGNQREDAYRFLRKQIDAEHQAFIVYPLVEESEVIDARAATAEYERLAANIFPDLRLGLLHGRMRPAEKDAIMTKFRDREIDILVSTSVIEVGIDIPNATVMLIEGADRFGLSQLHQFRGRVGRGAARSYCILVADETSEHGRRRLDALVQTQDGFRLAEIDLEIRGPGEFFGIRQSGIPDLKFASLGDVATLTLAREEAHQLLETDPALANPEHGGLRDMVDRFWSNGAGDLS